MRRILAVLAGAAAMVLFALAGAANATPAPVSADGQVVLIGVPGLHWNDVRPERAPNLWRLASQSALGSLSPRAVSTSTCPYDGWLTVSAGIRSAVGGACGPPPSLHAKGEGAQIPDFSWLWTERGQDAAGTFGAAAHAAGQCTTAVGHGAALALADRSGVVDLYADSPDGLSAAQWARCRIVAVDVDDLIRPYLDGERLSTVPEKLTAAQRKAAVTAADARVGAVLAKLAPDAKVMVAGLSDHGSVPHLRVAMWRAPGAAGHLLGAVSTHRDDIVLLPDITASLLSAAGVAVPPSVIGVPWEVARALSARDAIPVLLNSDLTGQAVRNATGWFFTAVASAQVLFYAGAYLLLRRRRGLPFIRMAALGLAALPVSTSLVNLLPWNMAAVPTPTLIGGVIACATALTLVAFAGPWRRGMLGPSTVVAAATAAVLVGDLVTGTKLQINGLMGYTAVVGGRYYGLGNISFALLATSILLLTTSFAEALMRAGRRRTALTLIVGLGGVALVLDGWPGLGSDFGGVIAFVPGIAVTALIVAGKRVSFVRLSAFCVAGGALVMGIAYLDHLRPPASQTHLGRFVGQVTDGTFLPVIGRKLEAMLKTMVSPNLMPIVITALAFLIFALLRPGAASAGVLPAAFERAPMFKAGLVGALVSGIVGTLVNDSGVAVLSMALALAVPLALVVGIQALRSGGAAAPGPAPGPSDDPPRGPGVGKQIPGLA